MSSAITTLPAIGVDVGFFSTKFTTGRRDKHNRAVEVIQFPSVAPRISGSMKSITASDRLAGVLVEVEPGAVHFVGGCLLGGTYNGRSRSDARLQPVERRQRPLPWRPASHLLDWKP